MLTDQTERRLAEDIIREKALMRLEQEIPHGIDVEVEKFRMNQQGDLCEIAATVYCERESHKKIIIGKNGEALKVIGTMARKDIEKLLSTEREIKVYLNLWVKTRKDWRDDESSLKRMGYFD